MWQAPFSTGFLTCADCGMWQIRDAIYFQPPKPPPPHTHFLLCSSYESLEGTTLRLAWRVKGANKGLQRGGMDEHVCKQSKGINYKKSDCYLQIFSKERLLGKPVVFIASFPKGFSCTVASHLDPLGYFEPSLTFFISHLSLNKHKISGTRC